MDIFTAPPERIFGNVALASLVAGIPAGIVLSLLGAIASPGNLSPMEWLSATGEGLLLGPTFTFIGGSIFIVPTLYTLRYIDYAGPFFVYAISVIISLVMMSDGIRAGLATLLLSLPASYVFCRQAYSWPLQPDH